MIRAVALQTLVLLSNSEQDLFAREGLPLSRYF